MDLSLFSADSLVFAAGSVRAFFEFFCLVKGVESIKQLGQVTVEYLLQFIQGQTNAVIGNTSLWIVVGTDTFCTVTCTNLQFSFGSNLFLLLSLDLS